MRYSKIIFILGFLLCLCLTACGKETMPNNSTPNDSTPDITTGAGTESYTKYVDYEPIKAEPIDLLAGDKRNILIAYFSRSGNKAIPEGVDAVSSASLNKRDNRCKRGSAILC